MRRFLFLLAILISANAWAQFSAPLPRLYWENHYLYNTAATNIENKRNAFAGLSIASADFGGGIMWLGYTHPLKNGKHVLGACLGSFAVGDRINNYFQDYINLSYSYKLHLAEKSDLRFGTDIRFMKTEYWSSWDIYPFDIEPDHIFTRQFALNFSTFYTLNKFYAGVSLNNPLVMTFNNKSKENKQQTLSYLTAGYKFSLEKDKIEMSPKVMLRSAYASKTYLVDFNNSFIFADIFTFGASYRRTIGDEENKIFGLNTGVKIRKKFTIGLASDITDQGIYDNTFFGGGEFILNYAF